MPKNDPPPPVAEVWPPPPTVDPTPKPKLPPFASVRTLSRVAAALTSANIVCYALGVLVDGNLLPMSAAAAGDISSIGGWVAIVAWLCFFPWVYRADKNLPVLGAEGLRYTPAWAVGWFFVPFLGLYRPYQVFCEMWQASDPNSLARAGRNWQLTRPPVLVPAWWLFSVIAWGVNVFYLICFGIQNPQPAKSLSGTGPKNLGDVVNILTDLLPAVSSALTILVILAITDREEQAARSLA